MIEEILGKSTVTCDFCKIAIDEKSSDGEAVKALFPDPKGGKDIERHFHDYNNCLRGYLNNKAKLLRKSKAAEYSNGVWSVDYSPIQFVQSKLWDSKTL